MWRAGDLFERSDLGMRGEDELERSAGIGRVEKGGTRCQGGEWGERTRPVESGRHVAREALQCERSGLIAIECEEKTKYCGWCGRGRAWSTEGKYCRRSVEAGGVVSGGVLASKKVIQRCAGEGGSSQRRRWAAVAAECRTRRASWAAVGRTQGKMGRAGGGERMAAVQHEMKRPEVQGRGLEVRRGCCQRAMLRTPRASRAGRRQVGGRLLSGGAAAPGVGGGAHAFWARQKCAHHLSTSCCIFSCHCSSAGAAGVAAARRAVKRLAVARQPRRCWAGRQCTSTRSSAPAPHCASRPLCPLCAGCARLGFRRRRCAPGAWPCTCGPAACAGPLAAAAPLQAGSARAAGARARQLVRR